MFLLKKLLLGFTILNRTVGLCKPSMEGKVFLDRTPTEKLITNNSSLRCGSIHEGILKKLYDPCSSHEKLITGPRKTVSHPTFWQDYYTTAGCFDEYQKVLWFGVVQKALSSSTTESSQSSHHNRFKSLLAISNDSQRKEIWKFVGKHHLTLQALPSGPGSEGATVSAAAPNLQGTHKENCFVNLILMSKADWRKTKEFVVSLEYPELCKLQKIALQWREVKQNVTTGALRKLFGDMNALLAGFDDGKKAQFWAAEGEKKAPKISFGTAEKAALLGSYLRGRAPEAQEEARRTMERVFPDAFSHRPLWTEEFYRNAVALIAVSAPEEEEFVWTCIKVLVKAHVHQQKLTTILSNLVYKIIK
ncbi:hypothetical protein PTTG_09674 [Puccinia triticina 1-1 BBBD Race 1]|uniref:Uncharacterized protein n=1 Tax=Puccinia triticina (isolate 1-1 / race 1 (BBBD)) TaxID=630390 RepID=A0A180H394_PUCT1|nr:hypothetical protein PTTG_09674 [Puccinia triticina 1-1 BBBD Race 1]